MSELETSLKIADLHAQRLRLAIKELSTIMPMTAIKMDNLSLDELKTCDMFSSRFSKLQDLMGAKIFPLALELSGELIDRLTFIDILHRLEKLNLIKSTEEWMAMRKIRNHLAHEYPDHPEIAAKFFNNAFGMAAELLINLNNIEEFINRLKNSGKL